MRLRNTTRKIISRLEEKSGYLVQAVEDATARLKYRLVGVPFYDNEDENQFRESLYSVLN